jgi:hypothetical protein
VLSGKDDFKSFFSAFFWFTPIFPASPITLETHHHAAPRILEAIRNTVWDGVPETLPARGKKKRGILQKFLTENHNERTYTRNSVDQLYSAACCAYFMPVWIYALLVGLTDIFSTAMFLQLETLAGAASFSHSGAFMALLYGAIGSYALGGLRFYGSHQPHLRSLSIDNLYPFLVMFQAIVLKFFRISDGFKISWSPSTDLQNPLHVLGMVLFLVGVFMMTYFHGPTRV